MPVSMFFNMTFVYYTKRFDHTTVVFSGNTGKFASDTRPLSPFLGVWPGEKAIALMRIVRVD